MLAQLRAAYETAALADARGSTPFTRAVRRMAWDAYARPLPAA